MKSSAKNISLSSYDDIFSTEDNREDTSQEKVQMIPLSQLHPFENHPFKVKDDEAMMDTAESVKQYGVLIPALARPRKDGGYELVSGHRRHRASELAGLDEMPVIVRDLDDDAATIIMVPSSLPAGGTATEVAAQAPEATPRLRLRLNPPPLQPSQRRCSPRQNPVPPSPHTVMPTPATCSTTNSPINSSSSLKPATEMFFIW